MEISREEAHASTCSQCWKPAELCLCQEIRAKKSPIQILVLQHPQEAGNPLGTARLLSLSVEGAVHVIGHSWRNVGHALGRPKHEKVNPREWAVLFVGTKKNAPTTKKPFEVQSRGGEAVLPSSIKGIILLDGNWSQSKTLWWRNSWLLRHPRILMNPTAPSAFGKLRRQPRKNCLSTLEAAAYCIENLRPKSGFPEELRRTFFNFLEKCEATRQSPKSPRETLKSAPPAEDSTPTPTLH